MTEFTYEEANRRYTERYTHVDREIDPLTGLQEVAEYRPLSICTSSEMDEIFAVSDDWDTVLEAMRARIGTPGPVIRRR